MSQLEQTIAAHLAARELEAAAVATLRAYGPEILGFLMSQLRSDQHAEDVFSMFAEDLWRSLPNLTLHSTMRAYAYALARNAKSRFLARDLQKQRRALPLSQVAEISRMLADARTGTAPYIATSNKHKVEELRARLSEDEQALLTLRVDRGLEWREIAEVFGEEGDATRASARVRKRFQLVKEKLSRYLRDAGMLEET